jgi:drug/metabolite transporter (DMT)-like permease
VTQVRNALDSKAVGLMLFLTLSWGMNGVAAKISNTGYDPIFLTVIRSAIAMAAVYLWCRLRSIPLFEKDNTLWPGVWVGVLFGAEFVCLFVAFDYSSVGRVSLLLNTMPFIVLIGSHFLLGEKMDAGKVIGLLLAFAGVAVIFSDRLSTAGENVWLGDVLGLSGAVLWAATTLLIKRSTLSTSSPEKVLSYQLVFSTIFVAPLLLFVENPIRDVNTAATIALLFQAIFVVAFTYLLWFWLVRRYPASSLSSFTFLTPAFAVFGGWLILSEPISWKLFLSLAMIAMGIFIVNRPRRTVPPAA